MTHDTCFLCMNKRYFISIGGLKFNCFVCNKDNEGEYNDYKWLFSTQEKWRQSYN